MIDDRMSHLEVLARNGPIPEHIYMKHLHRLQNISHPDKPKIEPVYCSFG